MRIGSNLAFAASMALAAGLAVAASPGFSPRSRPEPEPDDTPKDEKMPIRDPNALNRADFEPDDPIIEIIDAQGLPLTASTYRRVYHSVAREVRRRESDGFKAAEAKRAKKNAKRLKDLGRV